MKRKAFWILGIILFGAYIKYWFFPSDEILINKMVRELIELGTIETNLMLTEKFKRVKTAIQLTHDDVLLTFKSGDEIWELMGKVKLNEQAGSVAYFNELIRPSIEINGIDFIKSKAVLKGNLKVFFVLRNKQQNFLVTIKFLKSNSTWKILEIFLEVQ